MASASSPISTKDTELPFKTTNSAFNLWITLCPINLQSMVQHRPQFVCTEPSKAGKSFTVHVQCKRRPHTAVASSITSTVELHMFLQERTHGDKLPMLMSQHICGSTVPQTVQLRTLGIQWRKQYAGCFVCFSQTVSNGSISTIEQRAQRVSNVLCLLRLLNWQSWQLTKTWSHAFFSLFEMFEEAQLSRCLFLHLDSWNA